MDIGPAYIFEIRIQKKRMVHLFSKASLWKRLMSLLYAGEALCCCIADIAWFKAEFQTYTLVFRI